MNTEPFAHVKIDGILDPDDANAALDWLRTAAPWNLRIESFYEQHEFSLLTHRPPGQLEALVEGAFLDRVQELLQRTLSPNRQLALVDVSAHRLTSGQTIRVHNDYLGQDETHRLLIQLNTGWSIENGGLLMLFSGPKPENLSHVVMPTHGSGFAFEISRHSFHAVSTVNAGERFTIVYTFREAT